MERVFTLLLFLCFHVGHGTYEIKEARQALPPSHTTVHVFRCADEKDKDYTTMSMNSITMQNTQPQPRLQI